MKKKIFIGICSIVLVLILLFLIDIIFIFTNGKPIFAKKDGNVYNGLLYNTYVCQEYTVPQIKFKWEKYNCSTYNEEASFDVIDYEGPCAEALEGIYQDDEYEYYLSCLKSDLIKIKFSDGKEYTLKEVLDNKILTIEELIDNGLKVYKEPKENNVSFEIVDYEGACLQEIEEIYKDENYVYSLSCLKSDLIKIKFSDGKEYTLKEVLDNKILTIEELINNGLKVYKDSIN